MSRFSGTWGAFMESLGLGNIIQAHLKSLPEKNKTHAHYMLEIDTRRNDAYFWSKGSRGKLIADDLDYEKPTGTMLSRFISIITP